MKKNFHTLFLLLLCIPVIILPAYSDFSGSITGCTNYGGIIVGSNVPYIIKDIYNQSAIGFSLKNGNIQSLVYSNCTLINQGNESEIRDWVNHLYNTTSSSDNVPDVRNKLINALISKKDENKPPEISLFDKMNAKNSSNAPLIDKLIP